MIRDHFRVLLVDLSAGKGKIITHEGRDEYGGAEFACVLGQEMADYATGEVFYTAQSLGFRHSHLDSGGYSYDQKHDEKDVQKAVDFLLADERDRANVFLLRSFMREFAAAGGEMIIHAALLSKNTLKNLTGRNEE